VALGAARGDVATATSSSCESNALATTGQRLAPKSSRVKKVVGLLMVHSVRGSVVHGRLLDVERLHKGQCQKLRIKLVTILLYN
jgi:hypothetical protein